jgi:pimeloyl-ACP methyl ester carboxylesterase
MNKNYLGKINNVVVILTAVFCFVLIASSNTLPSFIGSTIPGPFVYVQANLPSLNSESQFDIYRIPMKKASVGDIDIAYKTFGNGTNTILLVSGGSNTMNFWDPNLLKTLAKNNSIIVFDSRGIGNTTSGDKPFSIKQFANDTVGLLDAIGVRDKVDVMGFSLGSLVAQEVAYMHQEKVNRLILYGSLCGGQNAIPPSPVLRGFTNALQAPERTNSTSDNQTYGFLDDVLFPPKWMQENPDYLDKMPRQGVSINSADAARLLGAFMDWVKTESCNKLDEIKVPTLVIVGTDDVVTSPANSLNLVMGITGAWLIQIWGGGHGVMFQYPEEFANAIEAFIASMPS